MGPKSGWGGGVVRLSQTSPIPRSPDGDNKKECRGTGTDRLVCWPRRHGISWGFRGHAVRMVVEYRGRVKVLLLG